MKKTGFTLLEVMVSVAVLAMMTLTIALFTNSTIDAEDRMVERDEIYQMARLAVGRVVDDVNMAFLVTNSELLGKDKEGSKVETAFIGDDKGNMDTLDMNTFSHWRMFRDEKVSEQAEVGYYSESDPDNRDLYRLMRRESTLIDNDVSKGGKAWPVAEGVSEFQLSYYDARQNKWTDNWNSKEVDKKDKLPRAVKISISFPNPIDKEDKISFSTIAFIGLWQYPIEF